MSHQLSRNFTNYLVACAPHILGPEIFFCTPSSALGIANTSRIAMDRRHPLPHRLQESSPRLPSQVAAEQARWMSWFSTSSTGDDDDESTLIPVWTRGPSEAEARALISFYLENSLLPSFGNYTLRFLDRGAINFLFYIELELGHSSCLPSQLLLRIPLPWDPTS